MNRVCTSQIVRRVPPLDYCQRIVTICSTTFSTRGRGDVGGTGHCSVSRGSGLGGDVTIRYERCRLRPIPGPTGHAHPWMVTPCDHDGSCSSSRRSCPPARERFPPSRSLPPRRRCPGSAGG